MAVRLEDSSVPEVPVLPTSDIKTAVGLDMGITKLVHCSDGSDIDNPKFGTNKKTKRILKIRQRRLSRTKKGSQNRKKHFARVASLHNQTTNRRNAYQWQVANKLVKKADAVVVENLNIQGMVKRCKPKRDENTGRFLPNGQSAKRGLNRSILDASWGELISKIEYLAAKSAHVLLKVDPRHTSQTCSACGFVDKASHEREKFICTFCGHFDHSDKQAARNIKQKAVLQYGLTLIKVRRDSAEPKQLTLFETPSTELTVPKRRQPDASKRSKRRVPGNLAEQLELFSQDIWNASSIESPDF